MNFFNIKLHTDYSLLEALPSIDEYILKAKEKDEKVLGIMDNNCYGTLEFYYACKKENIKPIIGLQVNVKGIFLDEIYTLNIIAKNEKGLKEIYNISTISSENQVDNINIIDYSLLENFSNIYITSSSFKGEISKYILEGNFKKAANILSNFNNMFKNFYLELPCFKMSETSVKLFSKLTELENIKYILTNDVYYLEKEDRIIQKIFSAIKENRKLDKVLNDIKYQGVYYKTIDDILGIYDKKIEKQALENLKNLVDSINIEIKDEKLDFPDIKDNNLSDREYIEKIVNENFYKKYKKDDKEALERLEYELNIIEKMGYIKYFLIVYDFINYAKNNDIYIGPGRGSAAGSIVSYLLDITEIDPIKYGLIFERFLNPERVSMPDIDVDIEQERRGEVIEYIKGKYGKKNVSQIITFATYKPKLAIRDVARVLSINESDIKYILKQIDENDNLDTLEIKEEHKMLLEISKKIKFKPKNTSTHAAGIIISKNDLYNELPLIYNKYTDDYQVQFQANILEKLGYLKMDILGLKNLNVIKTAIKEAKLDIDIYNMPYSEKTFKMLNAGYTLGIFQLESFGITSLLKQMKVKSLEDISLILSLYRPGPLNSGYIPTLIERKNKNLKFEYFHNDLKEILSETYGIIVYQEQIMRIAREISGYSLGKADELRKAIGKKNLDILNYHRNYFIDNAKIDKKTASEIYDLIEKFGNYGFNKAHSISYAMIAYQTAYLKANYPQEFYSSMLSLELKDENKLMRTYKESKKRNISILNPSINKSYEKYIKENENIRMPFSALKELSEMTALKIVKEREKGSFKDFLDFLIRCDFLNKNAIKSLILSNAFDEFNINRKTLINNFESAMKWVDEYLKRKKDVFGKLFLDLKVENKKFEYIFEDEFSISEIINFELEYMKIPLSAFKIIDNNIYYKLIYNKQEFDLAYILSISERYTKNNELMAEIEIITDKGLEKVMIFPKDYLKINYNISKGDEILFEYIKLSDGKLAIKNILNIEKTENYTLQIKLNDNLKNKEILKKILKENQGNSDIYIYIKNEKIKLNNRVNITKKFLNELLEILNIEDVKLKIK